MHSQTSSHRIRASRSRRAARRAFSLVELIVAITIMAILVALVVPRLSGWLGFAKVRVARADVETISQQVRMYMTAEGMTTLDTSFDLTELTEGANPLLRPNQLTDPWKYPYQIKIPGDFNPDYDVLSYGADNAPGGVGDNADIIAGDTAKKEGS